jgi:hypothetical protein
MSTSAKAEGWTNAISLAEEDAVKPVLMESGLGFRTRL